MGAQLGLRITKNEYWEIVDEIDLGYYSGPPNGANSWILKKTVDVRDDIEIGTKHNVSAIIIINGKKCETLDSMIELREKTLEYDLIKDEFLKKKNYNNLIRLKKWKQLPQ